MPLGHVATGCAEITGLGHHRHRHRHHRKPATSCP